MPITLITGPANAGKARAVMQALARHAAHGEQPLLVLPTGADADRYRRELAWRGPVTGASVCLFDGLLERIARSASIAEPTLGRPALSRGAREQMLFTLVSRIEGSSEGARRLARALSGAIAELQAADLRPGQLRQTLRGHGSERRSELLIELHERYNRELARHQLLDGELRARRALDVLRGRPALWRSSSRPLPVLLYGFDDLTGLEMDAVQTLGEAVDAPVTVALAYEPGRVAFAGRAWAFEELAPRAAKHLRLNARSDYYAQGSRATLHHIERRLFEVGAESLLGRVLEPAHSEGEMGEQLSFADAWAPEQGSGGGAEARGPAQAEGVRLLRGSSREAELALVAAEARALIEAGFAAQEIAIVHRLPERISRALADALDAEGVPHSIFARTRFCDTALGRALIGLVRCGCEGVDGLAGASLADLLAWLRAPGVLQRVDLADDLERRALRAGVRDAAGARRLWEHDHWPLDSIERVRSAAGRGASALLECAERELMRLFSAPRAGAASVLQSSSQEVALSLQAGIASIAQLHELESVDPRLLGGLAGVLDALLSAELPRPDRQAAAGVLLVEPLALRARRVRALFLCGMQEGVFPLPSSSDPIFSEEMRARLSATGGAHLARRQDVLAAERYLLYATVSRPEERLYLSWHENTQDGALAPPSLFLDDLCDLFEQDLRGECIRDFASKETKPGRASERDPDRLSRWERASAGLALEMGERELWSASSLERWAACPVSWFVERLLRAEDLEPEPEPRARGSIAHAVLGDVLQALRDQTGSAQISPASVALAKQLMRKALAMREQELPLSVAGERVPVARRRLEADLERYLEHEAMQDSPLVPTHLELAFGFGEQPEGLPPLRLAEGVLLRGRIDRIDVGADGKAIVYDYKSGRTSSEHSSARWVDRGRFQMALYMRAASELLGLRVVGGLYQPLAGADLRARGALAIDAGVELSCVKTDACEAQDLAKMVDAACDAAVAVAREAQAARLEPRPGTCAYAGGCMYPTICRCDR
jgi:RecB family exonuclease